MRIGGLIPAAGFSSRMGFYKPLADVNGKKMIVRTIESIRRGGAEEITVVTGHCHGQLEACIRQMGESNVKTVYNPAYTDGSILTSIKAGLSSLENCDAVYLLLADMPAVSPETFFHLKDVMVQTGKKIILPTVDGCRRHPPLISSGLFGRISAYEGEGGLRGFWQYAEDEIAEVPVRDAGCAMDADTPEDLRRLCRYLNTKEPGSR